MSDSRQARRTVSRMARRELARHWARTILSTTVIALAVALPVEALGSQSYERVDDARFMAAYWGHASVRVSSNLGSNSQFAQPPVDDRQGPPSTLSHLLAELDLPAGIPRATMVTATEHIRDARGRAVDAGVASVDFDSLVWSDSTHVVAGRLPRGPGEAVLVDRVDAGGGHTPAFAAQGSDPAQVWRGVRLGARLSGVGGRRVRVVGAVVMPPLYDLSASARLHVDLAVGPGATFGPAEVDESAVWITEGARYQIAPLTDVEISRPSRDAILAGFDEVSSAPSGAGWLALAGFAITATVIGASVRRRHRDLAQLALAGARPAELDRLAVTETRWILFGGAAVGVVVGSVWAVIAAGATVDPLVRTHQRGWLISGVLAVAFLMWIAQAAVLTPVRSIFERPVAVLLRPASYDVQRRHRRWFGVAVVLLVVFAVCSFVSLATGHAVAGGLIAIQMVVFLIVFELVCRGVHGLSHLETRSPSVRLALSRTGSNWGRVRLALAGVSAVVAVLTLGQIHQGIAGRQSSMVSAREHGMPTSVDIDSGGADKIQRLADGGWDRFALQGSPDVKSCAYLTPTPSAGPSITTPGEQCVTQSVVALSRHAVDLLPSPIRAVLNAGQPMPQVSADVVPAVDLTTVRTETPSGSYRLPALIDEHLDQLRSPWASRWPASLGPSGYGVLVRAQDLTRLGLARDADGPWEMRTDPSRLDADAAARRLASASSVLGIGTVFEATGINAWGRGGVRSDQLIGLGLALLVISLLTFVDRAERTAERRVLIEQGARRGLLARVAAAQAAVVVIAACVIGGLGALGILAVVGLLPARSVVAIVGWGDLGRSAIVLVVASAASVFVISYLTEVLLARRASSP